MDPSGRILVQLLICGAFGAVTAAIASHKGRNVVGWFFVGFLTQCIGLIIILCLSNLREEEARWKSAEDEQRRLREQLKQERMRAETFHSHVRARLDVHDQALNVDTRQLEGGEAQAGPAELAAPETSSPQVWESPQVSKFPQVSNFPDPATFADREWFAQIGDRRSEPLDFGQLKRLYLSGKIDEAKLVWTAGMQDWKRIVDVPGLLEALI